MRYLLVLEIRSVKTLLDFQREMLSVGHLQVLGEPLGAVLREWHLQGLPSDKTSVESAIVATTVGTGRWPLLIDPQRQACCWLKHLGI